MGGEVDTELSGWNAGDGVATKLYNPNSALGTLPAPTKKATVFLGWWTEPVGGTLVSEVSVITESQTIYAHWQDIWLNYRSENLNEAGGVYTISSAEELAFISYKVFSANAHYMSASYRLVSDIDLSAHEWFPIGDTTTIFKGTFDGNGYSITGLNADSGSTVKNFGFFGTTEGATIKNVKITVDLTGSVKGVGGIVGIANTGTLIENCEVYGSIGGDTSRAGGIAYINYAHIKNCVNNANVNASSIVGGIVATNNGGKIESSVNHGQISGGQQSSGGISGNMVDGEITNCVNDGMVVAENNVDTASGGIVGRAVGGTITNCTNSGTVEGSVAVGGIVGATNAQTKLLNCFNTGSLKMKNNEKATEYCLGGIVGSGVSSEFEGCYSLSNVEVESSISESVYLGALVGYYDNLILTGCGAEINANIDIQPFCGDGLNTLQLTSCYTIVSQGVNSNVTISQGEFDGLFVYASTGSIMSGAPVPKGIFWIENTLLSTNIRGQLDAIATRLGTTVTEYTNAAA